VICYPGILGRKLQFLVVKTFTSAGYSRSRDELQL